MILTLATAQAELPPEVYEKMQKESPEALTIKVNSVRIEGSSISVEATVVSVERSATGLHPGDPIRIHYTVIQQSEPAVGPGQPIFLQAGSRYHAYLTRTAPTAPFGLAARGESFLDAPSIDPPR